MKLLKGRLATPPPFRSEDWSVDAEGITASYSRAPNYTGYQFRITTFVLDEDEIVVDRIVGPWLPSSSFTELTDAGTYVVEIRPLLNGVVPGAISDKKEVVVDA